MSAVDSYIGDAFCHASFCCSISPRSDYLSPYPHTLLETNMTILHTVEPRVNGFPKNPPSKLLYKEALPAVPISFTQVRPGLEPAQLMRKFVKQYNELQNYKYVVHEWPSTLLVAYHTPVLLQERRKYHA